MLRHVPWIGRHHSKRLLEIRRLSLQLQVFVKFGIEFLVINVLNCIFVLFTDNILARFDH